MSVSALAEGRWLLIGVDGELQILSSEMQPESEPILPFPCPLEVSCVMDDILYGCWLDRELLVARMAAIDLSEKLVSGGSREELRRSLSTAGSQKVSGSLWTHVLESEPLAITADQGRIAFAIWNRGIYCIGPDSAELWRAEQIPWVHKLDDARVPVAVEWTEAGLIVWSRGGLWAVLSATSGDLLSMGDFGFDMVVENVITHTDQRLVLDPAGRAVWIAGSLEEPHIRSLTTAGPVNAACWDEQAAGWRLCAWRDDILWTTEAEQKYRRSDLGADIIEHGGRWFVLDNVGNWSSHLDEEEG